MASAGSDDDEGMISGINVTPLVDITLVLLIIMMVTARIIVSKELPMDLPPAAKAQEMQLQFAVELRPNGDLLANGKLLPKDEDILPLAKAEKQKNPDVRVRLSADSAVPYGRAIRILDLLKQAGVNKVGFGTKPVAAEPGAVKEAAP